MRMTILAAVTLAAVAGCAAPAPPPIAAPPPPPISVPVIQSPYRGDWIDWPLTPGDWSYTQTAAGTLASFGVAGRAPEFAMRCDPAQRRVTLERPGRLDAGRAATMTLRASAGQMSYPVANVAVAGAAPSVVATLAATDPQLDRLVFSRGRFVVETAGAPLPLVLPAWPEIARVIEDCR